MASFLPIDNPSGAADQERRRRLREILESITRGRGDEWASIQPVEPIGGQPGSGSMIPPPRTFGPGGPPQFAPPDLRRDYPGGPLPDDVIMVGPGMGGPDPRPRIPGRPEEVLRERRPGGPPPIGAPIGPPNGKSNMAMQPPRY